MLFITMMSLIPAGRLLTPSWQFRRVLTDKLNVEILKRDEDMTHVIRFKRHMGTNVFDNGLSEVEDR